MELAELIPMLIRIVAISMVLIGLSGFFMRDWIGRAMETAGPLELPVVDIEDVAVAADGRVYFALMSAERVQVYASTGAFLRNFPVNSAGGLFCVDLTDERLSVYLARGHTIDQFDLEGRPIGKFALDGRPAGTATPPSDEQFTVACKRDPRIARIDYALDRVAVRLVDRPEPLTIARRWWHYLLPGSFLSWLIFGIGLVLWPEWRRLALWTFRAGRGGDRFGGR